MTPPSASNDNMNPSDIKAIVRRTRAEMVERMHARGPVEKVHSLFALGSKRRLLHPLYEYALLRAVSLADLALHLDLSCEELVAVLFWERHLSPSRCALIASALGFAKTRDLFPRRAPWAQPPSTKSRTTTRPKP